jgi:SAM-dependent methyltransferase
MMASSTTTEAVSGPPHPWDEAAEGWSRNSALINAWLADVTPAMLDAAGIAPGLRVLDVAAGAGGQTLDIARRVGTGGQVLATDISTRVLELARSNLRAAGVDNVATQVADAQALGLEGAGFDAAVSRLGLMFCDAPQSALDGIAAALKPGGRFAAVVFSRPQANPCVAILMSTAWRHAGLPALSPFEPGSLFSLGKPGLMAQLLEGAGFAGIELRELTAPFRLPSSRHYLDFIRSSGSPIMQILAPLSEAARNAAWDDMESQLNQFASPQGWVGPNELLLCSAVLDPLTAPPAPRSPRSASPGTPPHP